MNEIRKLDLSVLNNCPELQVLSLSDNQLRTLDLAPLVDCPRLQRLHLLKNRLTGIDVSPLFLLPELESLLIDNTVVLTANSRFKEVRPLPPPLQTLMGQGRIKWQPG
jgi:Leucine-rich repeat (LRR) protein